MATGNSYLIVIILLENESKAAIDGELSPRVK